MSTDYKLTRTRSGPVLFILVYSTYSTESGIQWVLGTYFLEKNKWMDKQMDLLSLIGCILSFIFLLFLSDWNVYLILGPTWWLSAVASSSDLLLTGHVSIDEASIDYHYLKLGNHKIEVYFSNLADFQNHLETFLKWKFLGFRLTELELLVSVCILNEFSR